MIVRLQIPFSLTHAILAFSVPLERVKLAALLLRTIMMPAALSVSSPAHERMTLPGNSRWISSKLGGTPWVSVSISTSNPAEIMHHLSM